MFLCREERMEEEERADRLRRVSARELRRRWARLRDEGKPGVQKHRGQSVVEGCGFHLVQTGSSWPEGWLGYESTQCSFGTKMM